VALTCKMRLVNLDAGIAKTFWSCALTYPPMTAECTTSGVPSLESGPTSHLASTTERWRSPKTSLRPGDGSISKRRRGPASAARTEWNGESLALFTGMAIWRSSSTRDTCDSMTTRSALQPFLSPAEDRADSCNDGTRRAAGCGDGRSPLLLDFSHFLSHPVE